MRKWTVLGAISMRVELASRHVGYTYWWYGLGQSLKKTDCYLSVTEFEQIITINRTILFQYLDDVMLIETLKKYINTIS